MVELSLRDSRLKGNMDDDRIPNPNEASTAYVVATTSKGCFVRLSRSVEGRVILKELSDDFVPNPATIFPPGRLIVGKVKNDVIPTMTVLRPAALNLLRMRWTRTVMMRRSIIFSSCFDRMFHYFCCHKISS